ANREFTRHAVINLANHRNLIAAKSNLGKIFRVEKVCAAQVCVARRLSSPDLASIDGDFDGTGSRVFWVEVERAVHVFEMSTDIGDHHVPRAELSGGVAGFESPFSHSS